MTKGECPICREKGVDLTVHHVVEAPPSGGRPPSINICRDCHDMREKYRNYLRDRCHIDINRSG
ncbi:MAG: hypothetical protein MPJ05_01885 [Nitrosopumilus sp.]|nr:hypothetical protein [Nitrosopumilus sp.]